jgi:hypothetical protein
VDKTAVVAGTGFEGRAEVIRAHCREGSRVVLKRDPANPHDSNAVGVFLEVPRLFGLFGKALRQIGFIKAHAAKSLAKRLDEGTVVYASVKSYWAPSDREHPRVTLHLTDEI